MASIPIAGTIMPDGKVVLSDLPEDDRYVVALPPQARLYATASTLYAMAPTVDAVASDVRREAQRDVRQLATDLRRLALRCYAASELAKDG